MQSLDESDELYYVEFGTGLGCKPGRAQLCVDEDYETFYSLSIETAVKIVTESNYALEIDLENDRIEIDRDVALKYQEEWDAE